MQVVGDTGQDIRNGIPDIPAAVPVEINGPDLKKNAIQFPGTAIPGDYGNTVILDHLDGYFTVYSNNARILVNLGDVVLKGKEIAQIGRRNDLAALHFEIRRNSIEDNPLYYLP